MGQLPLARVSTFFLIIFSLLLFIPLSLQANAPAQASKTISENGVQITRTLLAGDQTEVILSWTDAGLAEMISGAQIDDEDGNPGVLTQFRSILPSPRGWTYELEDVIIGEGRIALPDLVEADLDKKLDYDSPIVKSLDRAIFRDIALSSIEISPFVKEDGHWFAVESIRVIANKIPFAGESPSTQGPAPSFLQAYGSFMTDGELDELGEPSVSGGYLVVCPTNLLFFIDEWIVWKEQSGFPITIIPHDDGHSYNTIRNDIIAAYDEAEIKPEYVLLVGDPIFGSDPLPTSHVGEVEPAATDHGYSTLEGDDIWPELWVGRFSASTATELMVIARKTVHYERGDYMIDDSAWLDNALVICDNTYSSTGLTSRWVRGQLVDYGFADVDSVWYPPVMTEGPISSAINSGVGWVNYRGFGSAGSWVFPIFSSLDAISLSNDNQTPVITSMVCGGGRFDSELADPCLGEGFLRAGTVNAPKGGVAFVGPSEYDTHTRWNNAIDMGFYLGILHEGIDRLGPAMFRGKMAVWNGFPNNREEGNAETSAWFYFYTYNILGDPGLQLRVLSPGQLTMENSATFSDGANDYPVTVYDENQSPVENATVTVFSEARGIESLTTDSDGNVRFLLDTDVHDETDFIVTVTKTNMIPAIDTVEVSSDDFVFGIEDFEASSFEAGQSVELTIFVSNIGEAATGFGTATLEAVEGGITIQTAESEFTNTLPGEQIEPLEFAFIIDPSAQNGNDPGLIISFDNDISSATLRLPFSIVAPEISPAEPNIAIEMPDADFEIQPIFQNNGPVRTFALDISFSSLSPELVIQDGISSIGSMMPGEQVPINFPLVVYISPSAFPGLPLEIEWESLSGLGRVESGIITITPGIATSTDPFGPDDHGYFVYDNTDVSWWNAPAYAWMEIDPQFGGSGTILNLPDFGDEQDASTTYELPFVFTFYGEEFDNITICSNGWLKMGESGEVNFRNWNLPDGGGPMNLIAPFWDDLIFDTGLGKTVVFYDEDAQRFIVQWSRTRLNFDPNLNRLQTFQAILYSPEAYPTASGDGEIEFVYNQIDDADADENYSTIGIRNWNGSDGLELSYATYSPDAVAELAPGRVYRFTTNGQPNEAAVRIFSVEIVDDGTDESEGDGDGVLDNGETVSLNIVIRNFGPLPTESLTGWLELDDPFVSIIGDGILNLSDLDAGADINSLGEIHLAVSPSSPDHHNARFIFHISHDEIERVDDWAFEIEAPRFAVVGMTIDDSFAGNDNGFAEPGETVDIQLSIRNVGRNGAGGIEGALEDVPFITYDNSTGRVDTLGLGEEADLVPSFRLDISPDIPLYQNQEIPLEITTSQQMVQLDTIAVSVGFMPFFDNFENPGNGNWISLQGYWHFSDLRSHSGSSSLRWGDVTGVWYPPGSSDYAYGTHFTLRGPAHISYNYYSDMSAGDTIHVKFDHFGAGENYLLNRIANSTEMWQYAEHEVPLDDSPHSMMFRLRASSNAVMQGSGFYIDDIQVFGGYVSVEEDHESPLPITYALDGPYPNPFNPSTSLSLQLPQRSLVDIRVYDLLGREIATLYYGQMDAGRASVNWSGKGMASGIYFIHVKAGDLNEIRKAVLIK